MAERIILKGSGKDKDKTVTGFKMPKSVYDIPSGSTILFSPDYRPEYTGKKPQWADQYEKLIVKDITPQDDKTAKIVSTEGLLLLYTDKLADKMVYELADFVDEQAGNYTEEFGMPEGGGSGGGGSGGGGGGFPPFDPFYPPYYPPIYTTPPAPPAPPSTTTIVIGGRTFARPTGGNVITGTSHLPTGGGGGGLTTGTSFLPPGGGSGGTPIIQGPTLSRPPGGGGSGGGGTPPIIQGPTLSRPPSGGIPRPPGGGGGGFITAPPIGRPGGTPPVGRNFGVDAQHAGEGDEGMLHNSNFTDDVPGTWEWASGGFGDFA